VPTAVTAAVDTEISSAADELDIAPASLDGIDSMTRDFGFEKIFVVYI